MLEVGPESAGSRPGPACYGRGGIRATITDAFAACGLVGLSTLGYAAVTIDRDRARTAVKILADQLDRSIEQTAEAIIRITVQKPDFPCFPLEPGPASKAGHADVWLDGAACRAAVYRRADLRAGQTFAGPAVVVQDDCTTVIPGGFQARVDEYANLRIAS